MGSREDLHDIFLGIAGTAYFQPPETELMEYPCIRYKRDTIDVKHADNETYLGKTRYQATVIDEDPDSLIVMEVLELPLCRHVQNYAADGLNHDVFEIYY